MKYLVKMQIGECSGIFKDSIFSIVCSSAKQGGSVSFIKVSHKCPYTHHFSHAVSHTLPASFTVNMIYVPSLHVSNLAVLLPIHERNNIFIFLR